MTRKIKKWLYFHSSYHRQLVMLGRLGVIERRLEAIEKKLNEK